MDPRAKTRLDDDPFVGLVFDGYRIEGVVGRGGMGVVYRATQLSLDRPVAIKVLPAECAENPQFLERFRREVDVLSRLSHPNIVTVMERGEVDGQPYVVMEFVEGASLREVVKNGPLPAAEALTIVRGVLSALEHAHDKGVIHRDIKPENVLVATGGIVKVADFGLGRLLGTTDVTRLTHTHVTLGTFEYMAPEQREKAKEADERSDLYATGVVLYEMLTGELPIGRFELPSARRPGECDRRVDEIIERSLDKFPDRRYQRASEMGAAVSQLLSSPVVVAAPAPPPQPAAPPPAAPAPWSQDWRFAIALTALWVFIVLAANRFELRDEEWMWLVVGALVSVWIIPRLRRITAKVVAVVAALFVVLLVTAMFYLSVGTDAPAMPDEANMIEEFERRMNDDRDSASRRLPPPGQGSATFRVATFAGQRPGAYYPDYLAGFPAALDLQAWVKERLPDVAGVYPAGVSLEYDRGSLWVRLDAAKYPPRLRNQLAAALAAALERSYPEQARRILTADAAFEKVLREKPPPRIAREAEK